MTSDDILRARLDRFERLKCLGGNLGTVSPALAAVLLGVSKSRVRNLIDAGALSCYGEYGFRLISLSDLVEFSKASSRRTIRRLTKAGAKPLLKTR